VDCKTAARDETGFAEAAFHRAPTHGERRRARRFVMSMSAATARNLRITGEDEILTGLHASPKRLPCRLHYDATGAKLAEQITHLDAYYPARLESGLLARHLTQIAAQVGPSARVI